MKATTHVVSKQRSEKQTPNQFHSRLIVGIRLFWHQAEKTAYFKQE